MELEKARICYLTAGAAGMYCGSCMRDNSLAAGLIKRGIDIQLLPLYTPIRTDEEDVSVDRVFFGGINVYLQQKIPLFRHLPAALDRWLDHPAIIRMLAARSVNVNARELGSMTLSMVRGESGFQRKEVGKLVDWLKQLKPDLVCLSNLLIGGSVPAIKRELGVPVLVTLQGDDLFLHDLEEPYKTKVVAEMQRLAGEVDGFVTFSEFYAQRMGDLLGIPQEKMHFTALGIDVEDFHGLAERRAERQPNAHPVIGYFARISPEKGFHHLVEAFLTLRQKPGFKGVRLKAGGWLSAKDEAFFEEQKRKITQAGAEDVFEHIGSPDLEGKREFFSSIDVFSVPAPYEEPKGMYVLEALACGVPVVEPEHGAFTEMVRRSGGGLLVPSEDPGKLADGLAELLSDPERARAMGESGRRYVFESCDRKAMVDTTVEIYRRFLGRSGGSFPAPQNAIA